jgi:hypothetical protein
MVVAGLDRRRGRASYSCSRQGKMGLARGVSAQRCSGAGITVGARAHTLQPRQGRPVSSGSVA